MSNSLTINRNNSGPDQVRKLLWPVAIIVFLLTGSYPTLDILKPDEETLTIPGFLATIGIDLVTAFIVFALVLPWALRRPTAGAVALTLSILGFFFAPGFWTGVPPALAAGGALLGWAGFHAAKGRRLSQAAFAIGLLGVIANAVSYADVYI